MSGVPFYAKRFVSGTKADEAIEVVKLLNSKGISASLDVLGENVNSQADCEKFAQEYVRLLEKIHQTRVDSHVSVKLTMLGLDIDEDLCELNLTQILKAADAFGNRVAFDMEGSAYTERTLSMYERVSKKFSSPEIVLQAYLGRTKNDLDRVLKANGRLRLCKGAYKETPQVALQKTDDIQKNYRKLVTSALDQAQRVCIATHDDTLINYCMQYITQNNVNKEKYEFQMLYGMRAKTWEQIVTKGFNMTVYVPYGTDWQAYYSRRLLERKENVFFILKNLFKS